MKQNLHQTNNYRQSTSSNNVFNTNYNYNNRDSSYSRGTMRSRPEDAYKNYQSKIKSLASVDYMNPIARLEYE